MGWSNSSSAPIRRARRWFFPAIVGLLAVMPSAARAAQAAFTIEAAQLLVDLRVGMLGTDSPSPDADPYPVHALLLGRGVLLLENLCGLEHIEPGPLTCACLPLPLVGSDAAPVRVVAWR